MFVYSFIVCYFKTFALWVELSLVLSLKWNISEFIFFNRKVWRRRKSRWFNAKKIYTVGFMSSWQVFCYTCYCCMPTFVCEFRGTIKIAIGVSGSLKRHFPRTLYIIYYRIRECLETGKNVSVYTGRVSFKRLRYFFLNSILTMCFLEWLIYCCSKITWILTSPLTIFSVRDLFSSSFFYVWSCN